MTKIIDEVSALTPEMVEWLLARPGKTMTALRATSATTDWEIIRWRTRTEFVLPLTGDPPPWVERRNRP